MWGCVKAGFQWQWLKKGLKDSFLAQMSLNQVLLPTEEWPRQFWSPEPLIWAQQLLCWLLFPLLVPSAPQKGGLSVGNREPNPGMLLPQTPREFVPLPAGLQAKPPWAPRHSFSCGKLRPVCESQKGLQQPVGISLTQDKVLIPSLVFPARFLTCKEIAPPCKACQPFTSTRGFSVHKPLVFIHEMPARTGRRLLGKDPH